MKGKSSQFLLVDELSEVGPVETFARLRSEFGHHFDDIDDVDDWCRQVRYGEYRPAVDFCAMKTERISSWS